MAKKQPQNSSNDQGAIPTHAGEDAGAAPAPVATKAGKHNPDLVAVTKAGQTIHVHHSVVDEHVKLGWKVA